MVNDVEHFEKGCYECIFFLEEGFLFKFFMQFKNWIMCSYFLQ